MTSRRSLMAGERFIGENIQHPTSNIQHPISLRRSSRLSNSAFDVGCWMLDVPSQYHQIIPMHHLDALQLPALDLARIEFRDAAREFRSVQIANADHVAGTELAFAPRDARR